jgi:hypothetical protein
VSPLAEAIYALLRSRRSLSDPRVTYGALAEALRDASEEFEHIYPRSRELFAALGEIGKECRRLKLPPLPALVVRADSRRPGAAYFTGKCAERSYRGELVAQWRMDLEAVKQTTYPKRSASTRSRIRKRAGPDAKRREP